MKLINPLFVVFYLLSFSPAILAQNQLMPYKAGEEITIEEGDVVFYQLNGQWRKKESLGMKSENSIEITKKIAMTSRDVYKEVASYTYTSRNLLPLKKGLFCHETGNPNIFFYIENIAVNAFDTSEVLLVGKNIYRMSDEVRCVEPSIVQKPRPIKHRSWRSLLNLQDRTQ